MKPKERGITLSALIITIIVLLILAGVSINLISGEDGIISSTITARKNYEIAQYKDQIDIAQVTAHLQDWKEEKTDVGKFLFTDIADGMLSVEMPWGTETFRYPLQETLVIRFSK